MLLKVETVLIGHLKLKPNSACVHFHSILRNLEYWDFGDRLEVDVDVTHLHQNLNPDGFGPNNVSSCISFDASQVLCVVFWRPKPWTGRKFEDK